MLIDLMKGLEFKDIFTICSFHTTITVHYIKRTAVLTNVLKQHVIEQ